MRLFSAMFTKKHNIIPQVYFTGDSVIVNHVEGRSDIPPGTPGVITKYHGGRIYSVSIHGFNNFGTTLGVFENDMTKQ